MTINNPFEFVNNLWNWGILDGCFGDTNIKPTDVDGEVERNGKFLRFEAKSPGVEIPVGQMIMFEKLVATGFFTVVIIWGKPNKPQKIKLMTSQTVIDYDDADIDTFRKIVSSWFNWADKCEPYEPIIARAHERGVLIRRATSAQGKRGKMAKAAIRETADKAREAQG